MSRLPRAIRFLKAVSEADDLLNEFFSDDDGCPDAGAARTAHFERGMTAIATQNRVMEDDLQVALRFAIYPDFTAEHDRAFGREPRGDTDPLGTFHGVNS